MNNNFIMWSVMNNFMKDFVSFDPRIQIFAIIVFGYMSLPYYTKKMISGFFSDNFFSKPISIKYEFENDTHNISKETRAILDHITKCKSSDIKTFKEVEVCTWEDRRDGEGEDRLLSSFYQPDQRKKFLIDSNLKIYGYVYYDKVEKKTHSGDITKITTNITIYSHYCTQDMLKNWARNLKENFVTREKDKFLTNPYIFNVYWKEDDIKVVYNKWSSTSNFGNTYIPSKKTFIDKIDFFLNNKSYFDKKGIPYSLGFGLWGPPGTGKTKFIKQLLNHTGRHAVVIHLSNDFSFYKLKSILMSGNLGNNISIDPSKCIFIFEEIDIAMEIIYSREKKESEDKDKDKDKNEAKKEAKKESKKTTVPGFDMLTRKENVQNLGFFLQIFDGVEECNGQMWCFTSNYPEKIDAAVIRKGRIDIEIKFDKLSKTEVFEALCHYYGEIDKNVFEIKDEVDKKYTSADLFNILDFSKDFEQIKADFFT